MKKKDKEMEEAREKIKKEITKRYKPKKEHKHWFQFVEKYNEYKPKSVEPTGRIFTEFICICGEQRIVEIKIPKKK